MLIALLSTLIVLCAVLLISFLWERRKCLRMQQRLFRESRKLERTSHIAGAVLKNVHAFILLIDNDFKVLKTNYYQKTGTRKGTEEKEWATCCNAVTHWLPKEAAAHIASAVPVRYVLPYVRPSNRDGTSRISKQLYP